MSEYRESVNRVKAISGDTKDPKTLHAHFESAATDVDRQVLASAPQAAQAIDRLERELEITKASLTDAEKAEHKLADAQAENEIRQAQREAFERACKAQCKKCRTTGLSTYDSRLREWGHHGYDFVRCDAVFIRVLMDEESTGKEPNDV